MRKTFIQQTILFIFLLAISANNLNAQGKTTLVDGHHLAGVNLTIGSSYEIPINYYIKQQSSSLSNPIPGFNIDVPYSDGNITINGIMSDAALAIDWWTLFGEPAEQYLFTWKAKDYYEIISLDATGSSTIKRTVNKNDLKKYPDLLLRYENIKPTEIEFEIQWGLEDKDVFNKTGMSFTSYYGVKNSFKTKVSSASILIEPSGKTPFGVPGIRQGKGEAFLGLENSFPKDKLQGLMQMFTKAPYQYINAVIVTKIKWPVGEMKAIADKYEQYQKGEATPSPTQIINEELRKNQNLTTYNNNDFWGDAYEDEFKPFEIQNDVTTKMQVIKSGNTITYSVDPNQYQLAKISPNSRFIIKQNVKNNTFQIINTKGVVQSIDGHTTFDIVNNNSVYVYSKDYKRIRLLAKLSGIMGPGGSLDYDSINKAIDALNGWDDGYTRKEKENIKAGREIYRLSTYLSSRDSPYGVGSFKKYMLTDNLKIVSANIIYRYFAEKDYK